MLPSTLQHLQNVQNQPTNITSTDTVSTDKAIGHGSEFKKNGKHYRVTVVDDVSRHFEPLEGMTEEEIQAYDNSFAHLRDAAQVMGKIANRLCDSRDGATAEGASYLANNIKLLDSPYKSEIAAHLLLLLKQGGVLHDKLESVIVPPCSKEEFQKAIDSITVSDATTNLEFDWDSWLDHLYDARPRITEGALLFRSEVDELAFEELLGESYAKNEARVIELFNQAVENGNLNESEWKEYNKLSQDLCHAQKEVIDEALREDSAFSSLCTRCEIEVRDGKVHLSANHYTEVFQEELKAVSKLLKLAADALPERAQLTKDVLHAQAEWCVKSDADLEWGRALPAWLTKTDKSDGLDINVICEEIHGAFGKAVPHISACQYAPVPEALTEIAPVIAKAGQEQGVAFLFLRALITGGHNEQMVVSGEKLPDPENLPNYKSMVYTNTSGPVQIAANKEAMAAVLGLAPEEVLKMSWVGPVWVYLHEYGHTLGGMAPFTNRAGDIEETNAQASGAYLSRRYFPQSFEQLQSFGAPWTAVRRAQQGPTEAHSRSDMVLIDEYLKSGAVTLDAMPEGKFQLRLVDSDKLTEVAFQTAIKMRLWEAGIPSELHGQLMEPFDSTQGEEQDRRIKANAERFVEGLDGATRESYTDAVRREADEYFHNDKLNAIGDSLRGVLASVPPAQSLAVMPTNRSVRNLLGLAAA